jgi:hypothetical protein
MESFFVWYDAQRHHGWDSNPPCAIGIMCAHLRGSRRPSILLPDSCRRKHWHLVIKSDTMCSSYKQFYETRRVTASGYESICRDFAEREPQDIIDSLQACLPHGLVCLVMGVDGNIFALHRLFKYVTRLGCPRDDRIHNRIIGLHGDVGALSAYILPDELFQVSQGRKATAEASSNLDFWEDENANPSSTKVRPAVLVPPEYVGMVLTGRFTPDTLWDQLVSLIPQDQLKGPFIDWVNRARVDRRLALLEAPRPLNSDCFLSMRERIQQQMKSDLPEYPDANLEDSGHLLNMFQVLPAAAFEVPTLPFAIRDNVVSHVSDDGHTLIWSPPSDIYIIEDWSNLDVDDKVEKLVDQRSAQGRADKIDVEALANFVEEGHGSAEWAKFVANMANLRRPHVLGEVPSEMFLQQHVFPALAALLYCFCPSGYVAGTNLATFHIADVSGYSKRLEVMPYAAITATDQGCYVLCMMELKNSMVCNSADMAKSILLASSSAVAFRRAGVQGPIEIPFVIGAGETAHLFTVHLDEDQEIPTVRRRLKSNLQNTLDRVWFLATVAVLVSKLMSLMTKRETILELRAMVLPNNNRMTFPTRRRSRERHASANPSNHPNKKQRMDSTSGSNEDAPSREGQ